MKLTVLDCTLRDGGYYNNWDFDQKLVSDYLNYLSKSGVQVVELGLRSFPRNGFHGPFAYTSDEFLENLDIPEWLQVGVMIDAKTILQSGLTVVEAVNQLFKPASDSKVRLVRVAAHFSEINQCRSIVNQLSLLGYEIGFNMMQSGGRSAGEIYDKVCLIRSWQKIDVLYFADSMGNMSNKDITCIISAIREGWQGPIGLHAHNNMGLANSNCMEAIKQGVSWIDSTITGMGRGAGNAQTEILLSDLECGAIGSFKAEPLYKLVLDHFGPLQKSLGWGQNFAFHYSALNNIHPTYAQELLSDSRYESADIVNALKFLSKNDSSSFDRQRVQQAFDAEDTHEVNGSWNAFSWCSGEDILIIGSGPSLKKYASSIEDFITKRGIKVLSINFHNEIEESLITAYVAADAKRLTLDAKRYNQTQKPIVMPSRLVDSNILEELNGVEVKDYDLKVTPGSVRIFDTGCEITSRLSGAYAVALCATGGARRIFFAGFDGYNAEDHRQIEMAHAFDLLKLELGDTKLISLTPTTYPIVQGSIYAPY